jgi:hypothetical protein
MDDMAHGIDQIYKSFRRSQAAGRHHVRLADPYRWALPLSTKDAGVNAISQHGNLFLSQAITLQALADNAVSHGSNTVCAGKYLALDPDADRHLQSGQ